MSSDHVMMFMPQPPPPDPCRLDAVSSWPRSAGPSCWPMRSRPTSLACAPEAAQSNHQPQSFCVRPPFPGHRADDQQAPDIALASFRYTPQPRLASGGVLARDKPQPRREVSAAFEFRYVGREGLDRQRRQRAVEVDTVAPYIHVATRLRG